MRLVLRQQLLRRLFLAVVTDQSQGQSTPLMVAPKSGTMRTSTACMALAQTIMLRRMPCCSGTHQRHRVLLLLGLGVQQ